MWNGFKNNWIVIRFALIFSRRAENPNFSHFWVLNYMGNFIGSNLFEPEPDQNRGPGIWLNQTLGPVHGSRKSCENWTDPNCGITIPTTLSPVSTLQQKAQHPLWSPCNREKKDDHEKVQGRVKHCEEGLPKKIFGSFSWWAQIPVNYLLSMWAWL